MTETPRRTRRATRRLAAPVALAAAFVVAACGGGGGDTGEPLQPPLDDTYRPTGKAAAGDVFVHLFEWRWSDIARECETFLGPAGYAGVQISPPSEHAVIDRAASGAPYPWWQRYQTVSYRLENSRSGTLPEFTDMVQRCKASGVAIYADAVINHMTAGAGVGSAGSPYTKYQYPAAGWQQASFHPTCSIQSYDDARQVQQCELVGLADLRTDEAGVRDRLAAYLIELHRLGVAGFRVDAAKHMHPRDIDAIVARVDAAALAEGRPRPYVFLEVINNPGEAVTAEQFFGVGYASGGASDVTDFLYGYRVTDAFLGRGGATLASLRQLTDDLLPADKSVVFVDNHDNQRGDNLYYASTVGGTPVYELAAMFMLAHPHGAPSVMSSYGFDRATQAGRDRGPPSAAGGVTTSTFDELGRSRCTTELGSAQAGQWICEHRRLGIAQMVTFREVTAGAPLVGFTTLGDDQRIAFARDGRGFFALNRSTGASFTLTTTLPDGLYCNVARDDYRPATATRAAQCGG
ncbi:MAG: alpha-amylase family protein, partial [Rubrivivax sp.]|nr:alpha-amylase family protein [Rubrivivax sp.]